MWRNWTVHNMISHPLSEVLYLTSVVAAKLDQRAGEILQDLSNKVHDASVPEHEEGTGRG